MATTILGSHNANSKNTTVYRTTSATINAGATSAEVEIVVPASGIIKDIKVICPTSVDFSYTLRQKTGITSPDWDIVYSKANETSKTHHATGLDLQYHNDDTTQLAKLYFIVVNNDGAHATGVMQFELRIMD
jgi:hypothetical protein